MTISRLNRYEVASLVRQLKAEILQNWETRARQQIPASAVQTSLALIDSLPDFLLRLAETLESDDPEKKVETKSEVSREHAESRGKKSEYTLSQVISEYQLLRFVIISQIASHESSNEPIDRESAEIIHWFIDLGMVKAATTYHEIEVERQLRDKVEIESTRIAAERTNQAKSIFLANMSHEIRSPLGAIIGFVGLLKNQALSPAETLTYISVIERNSHDLMCIIDDILDLSKIEAGRLLVEMVSFSSTQFFDDFAFLAEFKAREKGIAFALKRTTPIPQNLVSDPTRIRQILTNVVGNAMKFTSRGGVTLEVGFKDHALHMIVTDSGMGISDEQLSQLFQPFAQGDSSMPRKFGGTGLGLVLTKQIALALSGEFYLVGSVPGQGSVFKIRIPVSVPNLTDERQTRELESTGTLNGMSILLVEDFADNQLLIKQMIGAIGAKVILANDGAEGVERALTHNPDLVLMDIEMPVMNGHEALRILRDKGYNRPVIALTAHAMIEERERASTSGFDDFLAKPINKKALIKLLERYK